MLLFGHETVYAGDRRRPSLSLSIRGQSRRLSNALVRVGSTDSARHNDLPVHTLLRTSDTEVACSQMESLEVWKTQFEAEHERQDSAISRDDLLLRAYCLVEHAGAVEVETNAGSSSPGHGVNSVALHVEYKHHDTRPHRRSYQLQVLHSMMGKLLSYALKHGRFDHNDDHYLRRLMALNHDTVDLESWEGLDEPIMERVAEYVLYRSLTPLPLSFQYTTDVDAKLMSRWQLRAILIKILQAEWYDLSIQQFMSYTTFFVDHAVLFKQALLNFPWQTLSLFAYAKVRVGAAIENRYLAPSPGDTPQSRAAIAALQLTFDAYARSMFPETTLLGYILHRRPDLYREIITTDHPFAHEPPGTELGHIAQIVAFKAMFVDGIEDEFTIYNVLHLPWPSYHQLTVSAINTITDAIVQRRDVKAFGHLLPRLAKMSDAQRVECMNHLHNTLDHSSTLFERLLLMYFTYFNQERESKGQDNFDVVWSQEVPKIMHF